MIVIPKPREYQTCDCGQLGCGSYRRSLSARTREYDDEVPDVNSGRGMR